MAEKMKAIIKPRPERGFALEEVDIPKVGPQDVLIKVEAASICGTDLHIYQWDEWAQSRIHPPQIYGHEFAGEVVEVGPQVTNIKVGDYVSAESHVVCNMCFPCRIGQNHVCENCKILGVDRDGCFAEYVCVPELVVWRNDRAKLTPELASIQEPFGNAVQATLCDEITGNTVAVLGCGPIGLFAIGICKAAGATDIFACDLNEYRLDLARQMGATATFNARDGEEELIRWILDQNDGYHVDVALEMSGAPAAVRTAFQVVRNAGRVTLFGIPARPVELNLADPIFKGVKIYGISGRKMFETWYKTRWLFESGVVNPTPVITHRGRFEDFGKFIELMETGQCAKCVMFP